MKKLACILVFCLPFYAFSQEYESDSLDDLFSDPTEDIVTTEEQTESIIDVIETIEFFTYSGSFGATAGVGVGLQELDKGFNTENIDFLVGATANTYVGFNIRPDKWVSIKGRIESDITDENIANPWSTITISDLYLEYNLLDTAFISLGKFSKTVGNDFIDKSDGTSFLVNLPTILSGLNFYVNADSSTISNGTFDYKNLFLASWLDIVVKSTRITAGAQYKKRGDLLLYERFGFLLGTQTNIFGVNVFSELQYFTVDEKHLLGNAGLYYINGNFYGGLQYEADTYLDTVSDIVHSTELGFRLTSLFDTKINFNFISKLQFNNLSGFVIPAISLSPFRYVTVSFALPYIFGDGGLSVYNGFIDGEYALSIPTELSCLFSVSVSVPF